MFLLLALILLSLSCQMPTIQPQGPTQVSVWDGSETYHCNGLIVDEVGTLLTAGHCAESWLWVGLMDGQNISRYAIKNIDLKKDIAILAPYRIVDKAPQTIEPQADPIVSECVYFIDKDHIRQEGRVMGYNVKLERWVLDIAPQKGNSGSPVFNSKNQLVGVIVAGDPIQGLSYFSDLSQE